MQYSLNNTDMQTQDVFGFEVEELEISVDSEEV